MPTIADIYRTLQDHEKMEKSAALKKKAIASPERGSGAPAAEVGAVLEDVLGPNVAETKVRIKKKLEEVAGQAKAQEGLASDADDENPATNQGPIVGDKMPPGGDPSGLAGKAAEAPKAEEKKEAAPAPVAPTGVAAKLAAKLAQKPEAKEAKVEDEKLAEEKIAAEYEAAGRIMAHGFVTELNRLLSE